VTVPCVPVLGFSQGTLLAPLLKTSLTAARAIARSPSEGISAVAFAGIDRCESV